MQQSGESNRFKALMRVCDQSLAENHPCLTEGNPVLVSSRVGYLGAPGVALALQQYYFLVLEIVSLLSIARDRSADWREVYSELERNIGEELGSRTNGLPHREILKRCLRRELGVSGLGRHQAPATATFLNCFQSALIDHSRAFMLGMIYALEASANPELEILAKIINAYGQLDGIGRLVDETAWTTNQLAAIRLKHARDYTLTEFIYIHLVDFEKGHKSGLWKALSSRHWSGAECEEFMRGFEYCLDLMDAWWVGLGKEW